MVGVIHRILFKLVESQANRDAVLEVKRLAGVPLEQDFRIDEAYDDAEWRRLMSAACDVLKCTQQQAEQAFADVFFSDALERWPAWFKMSSSAREFLERQPRIHNGFASGVQNPERGAAINDKFEIEAREHELVVKYRSPNRLCGLYSSLAQWIIEYYGDDASVHETQCLKNGADSCEIHVVWA